MREPGIPQLLRWRWAPCAALVLGAVSFVGFTMLVIPDRIGAAVTEAAGPSHLGSHLSRATTNVGSGTDWSSSNGATETSAASPVSHLASRTPELFPKRGFTPPLDRPAEPAAAPPPAPAPPPPAPPPPAPEAAPPAPPEPAPVPAPASGP